METHAAPAVPMTAAPTSSRRRFFHHYLELIAVMLVSMMVLSGLFMLRRYDEYAQVHQAHSS